MRGNIDLFESVRIESSGFKAGAHSFYARLRAEKPVCKVSLPTRQEAWLLSRYDDVSSLLTDNRFAKDPANALTPEELKSQPWVPKFLLPLTRNMLGMDDPDHARLKRLVQAGFTPRRMETLAGRTASIAERLLDQIGIDGNFDLVAGFALPLPVTVISELLGVPEPDRIRFARWSHTLLSLPIGSWRMIFSIPDIVQFVGYLKKLVALKRKAPEDDLVSSLVATESDGDQLSGDELLAMIAILLSAGHETTTNLIGAGMLALLQDAQALAQLRADPGRTDTAVEELLRFAGPVETSTLRFAREEIEIAGARIPKGGIVLGIIASANRDESQFANADTLDLGRKPNRHLTFGEGGHYCVGAALARMEARVAFSALLQRFPYLGLGQQDNEQRWREGLILRGLTKLNLKCDISH